MILNGYRRAFCTVLKHVSRQTLLLQCPFLSQSLSLSSSLLFSLSISLSFYSPHLPSSHVSSLSPTLTSVSLLTFSHSFISNISPPTTPPPPPPFSSPSPPPPAVSPRDELASRNAPQTQIDPCAAASVHNKRCKVEGCYGT